MESFTFSTEVRVRFAETDAQGVAHHAQYLVWYEVGRVAYVARFAGGYQSFRDAGYEVLVTEAHVRYAAPARFDDVLRIWVRCPSVRGARMRYEYAIERAVDGALLADGWTQHAIVDRETYRPTRAPQWLAEEIARAEG